MTKNDYTYYLSNNGRGPMVARLISVRDGVVSMQRKSNVKATHWVNFTLSEKAFNSPSCGWKKLSGILKGLAD